MIADAMGWTLDRITDDIQPKLASVTISSEFLAVDPGYVCGIIQDGVGYRKGEPVDPAAHGGVPRRAGVVRLGGDRGLAGDLVEDRRRHPRRHRDGVDRRQLDSEGAQRLPGLHTMRDLALPSFFPGR